MRLKRYNGIITLLTGILLLLNACSGDIFHNYQKERDAISIPVLEDTTPPQIERVDVLTNNSIKVVFDEEVDGVTAVDDKNYYIQGYNRVNVLHAVIDSDNRSVVLTLSTGLQYGMYHGKNYTLLVQKVKDINGNAILNALAPFIGKGQVVATVWFNDKEINSDDVVSINTNSPVFTIRVQDNDSGSYSYSIDNSAYSSEYSCTEPLVITNLAEGLHTLKVIGRDSNGKWQDLNQATTIKLIVDTTPPVAMFLKVPDPLTNSRDVVLVVGGNDVVSYIYRINNQSWSNERSISGSIKIDNLWDGEYTVQVKGIDDAGNIQVNPTEYTFIVDLTNGIIRFASKPDRYTKQKNISITIEGNDVYFYRYSLNDQVWSGYISIDEPIVLSNLNDGDYTIRVIGAVIPGNTQTETQEISYTWTVDTKAPVATISNIPQNPTCETSAYIAVSSETGDVVKYTYTLIANGLPQQGGVYSASQPLILTSLAEGSYTIKVMGIDSAGNIQSQDNATTYSWAVDTTPPVASLSNTPSRYSSTSNIDINVNESDADVISYKYILNTVSWSAEINKNIPIEQVNLQDGIYTLSVIAKDIAGNWQSFQTPTVCTWEIDTAPPVVELLDKPPAVTNYTTASFTVGGVGVVYYKYRYRNTNDNWGTWSQEYSRIQQPLIALNLPGDGTYEIEVIGVDMAGNWQEEPTMYGWVINSVTTTAILENTPPPYTNSNSINITVTGVISYKYKLDSENWTDEIDNSSTPPIAINDLSEGYHILRVIGKNELGQWQEVDAATTVEWRIDTIAPIVQITSLPENPTNQQNISVKVYGVGVYAYKYSLDNPDPTGSQEILINNDDTIDEVNIGAGVHTLYVIAKDEAGNWQPVNQATSYTWTIDTSTPVAQFISGLPDPITNDTTFNIMVGGQDIISYKYKLDDNQWSGEIAINDPIIRTGLSHGAHQIQVIGKNSAGTWQSENNATVHSWIVDTTPPAYNVDFTLQNLPNNPTAETSINVTVDGTGIVKYKYKINNEDWSGPQDLSVVISRSGLLDNTYTLYVIVLDEAGNWTPEDQAATYTWRVDTTNPIAAITNRPENPTNQNWASFIIAGTGIIQYKYKVNTGNWSDWIDVSQHIELSGLPDGLYTIYVCGRKSTTPPYFEQPESEATTYTWEVDTIPPVAVLSNLPENPTQNNSINIQVGGNGVVAYRYRINNGPWTPATSDIIKEFPIALSGLSPALYQIDVIARDLAGNWQATPTTYQWTILPPPLISPRTYDTGDTTTQSVLQFNWVRPVGTADVKIQIAADVNFTQIVYGGTNGVSIGNVDSYTFIAESTEIQQYYARVSVNDESGKPVDDASWKSWGDPSDGITLIGIVNGVVQNAVDYSNISGANVEIRRMDNNQLIDTTQTDNNGEFTISGIPIGTNAYKIIISKDQFYETTKNNITIAVGEQTTAGVLYLVPTSATSGTITGKLIDANDASKLQGVIARVYDWQNNLMDTKVTNSNGDFTTITLNPGVYTIVFSKTGYYDLQVDNVVVNGNKNIGRQAICAILVEPMVRVIVLWGQYPEDLDLHVVGPTSQSVTEARDDSPASPANRFHVGYIGVTGTGWQYNYNELTGLYERGTGGSTTVPDRSGTKSTTALVQDVYPGNPITGSGYGPEAINLWRYGGVQYAKGIYTYTVRNFSGTNWYAGGINIIVRIYDSQGMVREVIMPQGANEPGNTTRDWKTVKINIQGNMRSKRYIYVPSLLQGVFYNAGPNYYKRGFDW